MHKFLCCFKIQQLHVSKDHSAIRHLLLYSIFSFSNNVISELDSFTATIGSILNETCQTLVYVMYLLDKQRYRHPHGYKLQVPLDDCLIQEKTVELQCGILGLFQRPVVCQGRFKETVKFWS